ncbi:patatin family protein [Colidextribacter sp. OB.20]|uniref:patatin-like phospholipase family protein n=1 Tax=Colidextribacter sp. OB.20 TaxID=2304568 RepID=UPI0013690577|nr:patatin family protein [Colidextribacter sp. OB.20]NBI08513.1 patatin family protein [Colidextribacter sp. OB.20]
MKTGLVLEGGALRAIFSSGVCDGLLEGNVMADYVIGVSAGIAYGVSYVSKQPRRNLEVVTRYAPDRRYMGLRNLADKDNRSYFGLEFGFSTIPNELVPFDYDTFAAFPGQVEAVVTNLNTGRADYLPVPRQDRESIVLQASCAMPLLFPIYEIGGQPYLDGGISDAIPWRRALERCDKVIVVLTRPRSYRRKPDRMMKMVRKRYRGYPEFVAAMENRAEVYNRDREELFQVEREGRALVIAPKSTLGVSRTERDTEKLRLLWAEGYQTVVDRLEEIRDYLRD